MNTETVQRLYKEINKLKEKIKNLRGPNGEKWENLAYTPQELYKNPRGQLADLMVYWDNLSWRAAGTIGHESMYLLENDTGPDDGVHDIDGIAMFWTKKWKKGVEIKKLNILDIYPKVLKYLNMWKYS